MKSKAFPNGRPIAVFESLDRFGRKRRGPLLFGLSHDLVSIQKHRAQRLGSGLVIEFANGLKFAQQMGVARASPNGGSSAR